MTKIPFKVFRAMRSRLGKDMDSTLAVRFRVTAYEVRKCRRLLGISAAPRQPWHSGYREALPLLGKLSDLEIARRVGATRCAVRAWRRRAGGVRPPGSPYGEKRRRLERILRKSPELSNVEIARRAGTSLIYACNLRRELELPNSRATALREKRALALALLGEGKKPLAVALRTGMTPTAIRRWARDAGLALPVARSLRRRTPSQKAKLRRAAALLLLSLGFRASDVASVFGKSRQEVDQWEKGALCRK